MRNRRRKGYNFVSTILTYLFSIFLFKTHNPRRREMVLPEEGKPNNVSWTEGVETGSQNPKQTVSEEDDVSCVSRCSTNEPHYSHIFRCQDWIFPLDRESS